MKKLMAVLLAAFALFSLTACAEKVEKDKVTIKYYADASAMLPAMKTGQLKTGLLPEPAATKITTMNGDISMKIDIQQVYGGDYPQAVLVAKKSVVENDPAFLEALMTAIEENSEWIVANDENAASAVDAINSALAEGVTPSLDKQAITKSVVENCNIYLEKSADARISVNEYLAAIRTVDEMPPLPFQTHFLEIFYLPKRKIRLQNIPCTCLTARLRSRWRNLSEITRSFPVR